MKKSIVAIAILALWACVTEDVVEDRVILVSIVPEGRELINDAELSGLVGDKIALTASAENDRGIDFRPAVQWMTSDAAVVAVDSAGEASLLSRGRATVTAMAFDLTSNEVRVTVVERAGEVAAVSVIAEKTLLETGESVPLRAEVLNVEGNVIDGTNVDWASDDESVITVDDSGLATAVAPGSATVTATADAAEGQLRLTVADGNVRMASFAGLNGYDVNGGAELTVNAGSLQLTLLDNFSASSGPGLYLYLSNNERSIAGGVEIGELRKNSGADTYTVTPGIMINTYDYVLVYCKPFGVPFGAALFN